MYKGYFDYDPPSSPDITEVWITILFRRIYEKDLDRLCNDIYEEIQSNEHLEYDSIGYGGRLRIDTDEFEYVGITNDDAILDGQLSVFFEVEGRRAEARPTVDNIEVLAKSYGSKKFEVEMHTA